jgi:hypothetical protein
MPSTFESVRAEALFVSSVQASDLPTVDDVRRAVAASLREYRIRGCAARVAGEFGDHPETAVRRMRWALDVVRDAYPVPAAVRPRPATVLALAS